VSGDDSSPTRTGSGEWLTQYADILAVLAGAAILLPVGVPAIGYAVGAGAWTTWRTVEAAAGQYARTINGVLEQFAFRIGYRVARIVLIVGAAVGASAAGRHHDGLVALLVMTAGFVLHMTVSIAERSRARSRPSGRYGHAG
jgi:hypothetical protein